MTWYLHAGRTKSGKPRYFVAKSIGVGALAAMPKGHEFRESVNGVVSVARIDTSAPRVADADLALVRAEVARHRHLHRHRVAAVKGEIVVFEPIGGLNDEVLASLARTTGMSLATLTQRTADLQRPSQYAPVMKFTPNESDVPTFWTMHRMRYSGDGGWRALFGGGPLAQLVREGVSCIGADAFFELM